MASSNFLFPEGKSINRPPMFNGVRYHYWKTRMQIFIEAIDLNIWEAIEIDPYIPPIGGAVLQRKEGKGQKGSCRMNWNHASALPSM